MLPPDFRIAYDPEAQDLWLGPGPLRSPKYLRTSQTLKEHYKNLHFQYEYGMTE